MVFLFTEGERVPMGCLFQRSLSMNNETLERFYKWCDAAVAYRLNRREFLKKELKAALLAATGAALFPGLSSFSWAQDFPDLVVMKGAPGPAVRAAVERLGGMKAFVKPGSKVVIKPNMSFADPPEIATNTHPLVTRELAAMCREAGAAWVRVLDHPLQNEERCIEGVQKVCEVFNEKMVFGLSNAELYKETPISAGVDMKKTDVARDVLAADVLIAAPVAKSHSSTGVSLSMKGMMGLVYDRGTMHRNHDLATAVVDLASLLKPHLVVIDATRVLSTNGPSGPGKVIQENTIIASRDMVAADALAVGMFEWYGRKMAPRQVKHILLAHERGLGRMDVEKMTKVEDRV
jgi:uncharacterized protein (DUF362 family)